MMDIVNDDAQEGKRPSTDTFWHLNVVCEHKRVFVSVHKARVAYVFIQNSGPRTV